MSGKPTARRLDDLVRLRRVRDRIDRDVLGFEVRNQVEQGGMHWNTVGPPGQPDVNIVLTPPGADPGITDDERRTIAEMMAKGTYAGIMIRIQELR